MPRYRDDEQQYENDYLQQPYQVTTDGDEDYEQEPLEQDDLLSPFPTAPRYQPELQDDEYEPDMDDPKEDYSESAAEEAYEDEQDSEARFHVAMNVFDFISVLIGVVVILLMVALMISLFSWLRTDILNSFTLLTEGLN